MSWTLNGFTVEGMTASDPYQPGHPVVLPDPGGVSEVRLFGSAPTLSYTFRQPLETWHGSGTFFATGGSLFSNNLPAPDRQTLLRTSDHFHRFVHANAQAGGRVTRWLDLLFSGSGRWATEAAPRADTIPRDLKSWDLYTTMRASIHPNAANHFDVLIVGARANVSGWSLPEALEALIRYEWPGNVRELRNVLERAVILCDSDTITVHDLPPNLTNAVPASFQPNQLVSLEEVETQYIQWVLQQVGGKRNQAAEVLKIDSKTLYRKLKQQDDPVD